MAYLSLVALLMSLCTTKWLTVVVAGGNGTWELTIGEHECPPWTIYDQTIGDCDCGDMECHCWH